MRVTHLVQKTPLEKLINKLLVYSFILILHPLSSLPASTRARQTFCFLIRGGAHFVELSLGTDGLWNMGGRRQSAPAYGSPPCHLQRREAGKEETRKRVGEGARKARPAISNSSGFFISKPQPGQTFQPASPENSQG